MYSSPNATYQSYLSALNSNMAQELNEAKKSVYWYRDVIRAFQSNKAELKKSGIGTVVKRPAVGRMYCYYYDPKTKEQLPHYDIFPLVIPIDYYPDGFLGLNLHYLPPFQRKIMFDQLLTVASDKKLNKNSSLLLTYELLTKVARFDGYKVCLKRYLYTHVRSPFLDINPEQWCRVVPLPLQSFKKGRPW
jgi:hypothetical protein